MYSADEIREILLRQSQRNEEIKFEKFEKLGIHEIINLTNNSISYTCEFCKKNLMSSHHLDLHVSENHDTFFELRKNMIPSFKCFLEACQFKSNDPDERKNHCISQHKFPHDFPFENSHAKKQEPEINKKKSPPSSQIKNFHFGHRSQRTFKSSGQTKIDMKELMDVLPDT
ncbi:protein lethal(2)k10201 [Chironomus tepperi]|uniref:protein lethal(2)k10201 n=1 Tax=Chironomus tepperi TaxID=113505 RepID=UPI00391F9677